LLDATHVSNPFTASLVRWLELVTGASDVVARVRRVAVKNDGRVQPWDKGGGCGRVTHVVGRSTDATHRGELHERDIFEKDHSDTVGCPCMRQSRRRTRRQCSSAA
jgi:hypothetical protein